MELRQLEYFVAVCEELHFTRAADKLGISQPNLSLQIKALEEEVGMPLFDRIGKRIAVTDAGSVLLKQARGIFQNLQNAKLEIGELRHHQGGTLGVGVLPSELDFRLTPMFIDFRNRYPNVRLKIVSAVDVADLVLSTEIDIGISLKPLYDNRLVVRSLPREEYGVVVSAEHELAGRESVSLTELNGLPIIMYPKGFWGRELVEQYCRKHGFNLDIVVETTSNPSLFRFVRENMGVTIQTPTLVEAIGDPKLRFLPIHDDPPYREMSIIYRADKYLGHAAQAFIHLAEERLKS
ncbi:LysR family transcriptional regulator [Paenibacillus cellulositrophicus]|uniref:LysR family transcriptional regulator n=1 Tax=Paenibacillus cellulositrophicus TaxID=562959 RepID=UPI003D9623D4